MIESPLIAKLLAEAKANALAEAASRGKHDQVAAATHTRYDQTARYLLQKAGALLFYWLLRMTAAQVRFERWLPTQLTLPGIRQRLCDGIAELADLERGGRPFAAILEIPTAPDATMTGRLLLAGGLVWLTVKPAPLPGDRYELLGVVLNLTGTGKAARQCVLSTAEWTLKPIEVDLETRDAGEALDEIEAGTAPREFLALIPMMQRGAEEGIIQRWNQIVGAETDLHRRADYALAQIFAERVGRREVWDPVLKGLTMIESPLIAKLLAEAKANALAEATPKLKADAVAEAAPKLKAETKADALVRVIWKRYRELPEELAKTIRACTDSAHLDQWLDVVAEAETLAQFRQQVGL